MDKVEDVERLFSWLKAPMVHYREFAPEREIADAVATWPAAHRAAVQTGVAAESEPPGGGPPGGGRVAGRAGGGLRRWRAGADPAVEANGPIMSGFEGPPPRQAPAGPSEPRPEADEPARHYPDMIGSLASTAGS